MKLKGSKVLITGGAGGIGAAIAAEALARGADVLLADRDPAALSRVARQIGTPSGEVDTLAVDLTQAAELDTLCAHAQSWRGGIDILINSAGINCFGLLQEQTARDLERTLAINTQAPMLLVQRLLAYLQQRPAASIVNIGSVFGNIGYPGYAAYSASKFAIRGFTEALRRELADTQVSCHYIAPRATRTGINTAAVEAMNRELGVTMDDTATVAREVCDALEKGTASTVVGWPEKLFARINAVLPGLVDGAIVKQLPVIRRYASRPATAIPSTLSLTDHTLRSPTT
jgi:short-subunit dehydrogenase